MIRFPERRAGEGLVGIPEVGVAVVECFSSASTTVNVFKFALLKFQAMINAFSGYVVSILHKVQ